MLEQLAIHNKLVPAGNITGGIWSQACCFFHIASTTKCSIFSKPYHEYAPTLIMNLIK